MHLTSVALLSLCLPSLCLAAPEYTINTVFTAGEGYPVYRIPAIIKAANGDLLAFCEGRSSYSDGGDIDLVMKRSTDNGATWGNLQLVHEEGGTAPITIGNPAPVLDATTGHVHLLFTRENDTVFHMKSTDHGATWSTPTEITSNVKLPDWGWYATGPCHGIQLTRGSQAGRLVIPANHRVGTNGSDSGAFGAQIIYSDDHGATWQMSAYADAASGAAPNETTLVELNTPGIADDTGTGSHIYINSRDYGSDAGNRSEAYSGDGGNTYTTAYDGNSHFVTPICQGSLVRFSATDQGGASNRIIFSSPNGSSRSNGSLWMSSDESVTWSQPKQLYDGLFAYSDMVKTADDNLGVLFETGDSTGGYKFIKFIRVNEEWLDVPAPPAESPASAFWGFEEKTAGAQVDTTNASILDTAVDGNARHLTAVSAIPYTASSTDYPNCTALSFSGDTSIYIADSQTGNNFDFAADDTFSIETVFRVPNGHNASSAIIAKDLGSNQPSWWLRMESSGSIRFLVSDSTQEAIATTGSITVNDGNWHQLVAIKNGDTKRLKLILDGVLITDIEDTTTGSHANSQSLRIGRFNSGSHAFTGEIDYVRIALKELTVADYLQTHDQKDIDRDAIPDIYEKSIIGDTQTLGNGDADGDNIPDLIEYLTGSDETSPSDQPLIQLNQASADDTYTFIHHLRDLPEWLSLTAEYSNDLVEWSNVPVGGTSSTNRVDSGNGLSRVTHTITAPNHSKIFARLRLTNSRNP